MSLSTILRRGIGLSLEVMTESSADLLAETLVAFASVDDGTVAIDAHLQVDHRLGQQQAQRYSEVIL